MKHVQRKHQKHQTLTLYHIFIINFVSNISHTPLQYPHFRLREDKRPPDHNKYVDVAMEYLHDVPYAKKSGRQRIKIIKKKHFFIFRFIPNKRQGSKPTSVLLEYLKTCFHKAQFSVLLKIR